MEVESDSAPSEISLPSDVASVQEADDPEVCDFILPADVESDVQEADDLAVLLPSDLESDLEGFSLPCSDEEMLIETAEPSSVPSLETIQRFGEQSFNLTAMEIFSPPRVLPLLDGRDPCRMSLDILTGWNLLLPVYRQAVMRMWEREEVEMLLLSPPCTIFSPLQVCFRNYEKMDPDVLKKKWQEGTEHVSFSMQGAGVQLRKKKHFVFEHPQRASSWTLPCVTKISDHPDVRCVDFDQCMLNLRAPNNLHMKKRTRIMTNNQWLAETLKQFQCDRSHLHQPIEGSMEGKSLSWWAQHYPDEMCKVLAASVGRSWGPTCFPHIFWEIQNPHISIHNIFGSKIFTSQCFFF